MYVLPESHLEAQICMANGINSKGQLYVSEDVFKRFTSTGSFQLHIVTQKFTKAIQK